MLGDELLDQELPTLQQPGTERLPVGDLGGLDALERCMRCAGSGAMPSVSTVGLSASFCSPGGSPPGSSMVTLAKHRTV